MKHSKKQEPPISLTDWLGLANEDWRPSWDNFAGPLRGETKQALLREQGWVCAYCGREIDAGGSHIEHFLPRSLFPERELDYANLFASCGPSGKKGAPQICGDAKENWVPTDPVNLIPSHPDCEKRFRYDLGGAVNPAAPDDQHVISAVAKLNLNETSLQLERSDILTGLEADILAGEITAENVTDEISSWRARDVDGRCKNFGHVAARYLEEELL
jgi:uncharacterized protein (TIGR02646 family)